MHYRESYVAALRHTLPQWAHAPSIAVVDALIVVLVLGIVYFVLLVQGLGPTAAASGGHPLGALELWVVAPWFGLGAMGLLALVGALGYLARSQRDSQTHELPE